MKFTRRKQRRARRVWNALRREEQLVEKDRAPDWLRCEDRRHDEIFVEFGRRRLPTSTVPWDLRPPARYISQLHRLGWRLVRFEISYSGTTTVHHAYGDDGELAHVVTSYEQREDTP